MFIEWVQYGLVSRGFSVQDIVFDLMGVLSFYAVVYSVKLLVYAKLL